VREIAFSLAPKPSTATSQWLVRPSHRFMSTTWSRRSPAAQSDSWDRPWCQPPSRLTRSLVISVALIRSAPASRTSSCTSCRDIRAARHSHCRSWP
jgi:hypothetical protein